MLIDLKRHWLSNSWWNVGHMKSSSSLSGRISRQFKNKRTRQTRNNEIFYYIIPVQRIPAVRICSVPKTVGQVCWLLAHKRVTNEEFLKYDLRNATIAVLNRWLWWSSRIIQPYCSTGQTLRYNVLTWPKIFFQPYNKTERFTVYAFYACRLGSRFIAQLQDQRPWQIVDYSQNIALIVGAVRKYYLKCQWIRKTCRFYRFITDFL